MVEPTLFTARPWTRYSCPIDRLFWTPSQTEQYILLVLQGSSGVYGLDIQRAKLNRTIPPNRRFISFKQVRASRPGFPGVPWRKWDEYCENHNPQTIEFAGSHYYDVCELLKCPEFKQIDPVSGIS